MKIVLSLPEVVINEIYWRHRSHSITLPVTNCTAFEDRISWLDSSKLDVDAMPQSDCIIQAFTFLNGTLSRPIRIWGYGRTPAADKLTHVL